MGPWARRAPCRNPGRSERRRAATSDNATHDDRCHPRKIFVGGLAHGTTTQDIQEHFARYGPITDAVVLRWSDGRSRGFGYVTFADDAAASAVLGDEHRVGDRQVDVKRAVPGTNKLFVGGLPQSATASDLHGYFEAFGSVSDAVVLMDPMTARSRGFGFVSFVPGHEGAAAVAESLRSYRSHRLCGKWVEVKSAVPPDKPGDGDVSPDSRGGGPPQEAEEPVESGPLAELASTPRMSRLRPDDEPRKVPLPSAPGLDVPLWAAPSLTAGFHPNLILSHCQGHWPDASMPSPVIQLPATPGYTAPLPHNALSMMPFLKAPGCPPSAGRGSPRIPAAGRGGLDAGAWDTGPARDAGDLFARRATKHDLQESLEWLLRLEAERERSLQPPPRRGGPEFG